MRCRVLLLMLACLIASSAEAQNSDLRDAEGKLLALERVGKLQAIELKDLKMLNEIMDENFVCVDPDGRLMDKPRFLAFVQNANSLQYQTREMSVTIQGATAIVTGVYQLNGFVAGKAFIRRARFVDTWLDKDGKWLVIASLSTPLN
jgi:ketosteroid isomerase-like protein